MQGLISWISIPFHLSICLFYASHKLFRLLYFAVYFPSFLVSFFLVVLGLELRTLQLLALYHLSHVTALFALGIFLIVSHIYALVRVD
jgi:hypothetical protein